MASIKLSPRRSKMSAVYGQCWPSNQFLSQMVKEPAYKNIVRNSHVAGHGPSKKWLCEQLQQQEEQEMIQEQNAMTSSKILINQAVHDQIGVKWKEWGCTSTCSVQDYPPEEDDYSTNPSLYKLTQNEFRRLTEQVNNVPEGVRFRGSGFKKYYTDGSGETVSVIYKSQLAASRKAFNDKYWGTYKKSQCSNIASRCKPIGVQARVCARGRPNTPQPPNQPRSKSACSMKYSRCSSPAISVPEAKTANGKFYTDCLTQQDTHRTFSPYKRACHAAESSRAKTQSNRLHYDQMSVKSPLLTDYTNHTEAITSRFNNHINSYDRLTPEIAFALSSGDHPDSYFCDRIAYSSQNGLWANSPQNSSASSFEEICNLNTTQKQTSESDGVESSNKDCESLTSGATSDNDSDEHSGDDPHERNINSIDINHLPNLQLRPEQLDHIHIPEYVKGDRRKYDFDITNSNMPAYEFSPPLSKNISTLDFAALAVKENNWRHYTDKIPENDIEANILDRLIEMERLQNITKDWEEAKKDKMLKMGRLKEAKGKIGTTLRHQNAKLRQRKCCNECTQSYCIGSCNVPLSKTNACKICGENHPAGNCNQQIYLNRSRSERVDNQPSKMYLKPRPKSCHSCSRNNSAKLINANDIIQGRPKSGHYTFSRAQNNKKAPPSRSASLSHITPDIERELLKLGINPQSIIKLDTVPARQQLEQERPSTACSADTHGRANISPGKSYFSQRRTSITDLTRSTKRIKSAADRNKGKIKRPTTAN